MPSPPVDTVLIISSCFVPGRNCCLFSSTSERLLCKMGAVVSLGAGCLAQVRNAVSIYLSCPWNDLRTDHCGCSKQLQFVAVTFRFAVRDYDWFTPPPSSLLQFMLVKTMRPKEVFLSTVLNSCVSSTLDS